MTTYIMPCPRCESGSIHIETSSEYHPEVNAWEPECIEDMEPDCNCWDTDDPIIYSSDLWELDTSNAELVDPEPITDMDK